MAHALILYVHVLSAVMLMGCTIAARLAHNGVLGAADLSALRGATDIVRRISQANPVLAMILLGSGVWLGGVGFWQDAWFWVAVATWIANLAMAVTLVVPGGQRLGAAAAQAGDGPVPAEVDTLRRAPGAAVAHDAMIGLDIGTLAIMVLKPALVEAVLWPLIAAAVMLLIRFAGAAHEARRTAASGAVL